MRYPQTLSCLTPVWTSCVGREKRKNIENLLPLVRRGRITRIVWHQIYSNHLLESLTILNNNIYLNHLLESMSNLLNHDLDKKSLNISPPLCHSIVRPAAPGWAWAGCPSSPAPATRSGCWAGWRAGRPGRTTGSAPASCLTTSTTPALTSPSPTISRWIFSEQYLSSSSPYLQITLLLWFYLWNLNAMMWFLIRINWLLHAEKCVLSPLESVGLSV